MWILPMSLRAKMAAVVLLGIFFIPFATSDLRGLTHILTCQDEVSTSLYIQNEVEATVLASADSFERDQIGLCGGLEPDLQLLGIDADRAQVQVSITNNTVHHWQGSVEVRFDNTPVPVAIGSVPAGETRSDVVEIGVRPGTDYEIDGTLRIGL